MGAPPGGDRLRLFNTLTREVAEFAPASPPDVGMYSCGPTVYADQHIGNMRSYVFADTLNRALRWKGYQVRHVVNITDVGHLTSDADEGEDKMERPPAGERGRVGDRPALHRGVPTRHARLSVLAPDVWCKATDHIPQMIASHQRWTHRVVLPAPLRPVLRHLPGPRLRAPGPARLSRSAGRGQG